MGLTSRAIGPSISMDLPIISLDRLKVVESGECVGNKHC